MGSVIHVSLTAERSVMSGPLNIVKVTQRHCRDMYTQYNSANTLHVCTFVSSYDDSTA